MKRALFPSLMTLIALLSCNQYKNDSQNRVYFKIPEDNRKIMLPVILNNGKDTANMVFDTGLSSDGTISIDSLFLASCHSDLIQTKSVGSGFYYMTWTTKELKKQRGAMNDVYKQPISVQIGQKQLEYSAFEVTDWLKLSCDPRTEGVFNVPANDTTHVWELNFEHNYLEIHDAALFRHPKGSLVFPLIRYKGNSYSNPFYTRMPLHIKCASGDTITIQDYFIDTGLFKDVILIRDQDFDFWDRQDDAVCTFDLNGYGYNMYYNTCTTVGEGFQLDSLRIYRIDKVYKRGGGPQQSAMLGLHFLKRFNVFFDLKHMQLVLQPIDSFKRIVAKGYRRCHYLCERKKGLLYVSDVPNYKKNYVKNGGLRVGDQIIAINEIPEKERTWEMNWNMHLQDTLKFDIVRDGKPMRLIIPVDKTEQQGD